MKLLQRTSPTQRLISLFLPWSNGFECEKLKTMGQIAAVQKGESCRCKERELGGMVTHDDRLLSWYVTWDCYIRSLSSERHRKSQDKCSVSHQWRAATRTLHAEEHHVHLHKSNSPGNATRSLTELHPRMSLAAVLLWCFGHFSTLLANSAWKDSTFSISACVINQFSHPYNRMGITQASSIDLEERGLRSLWKAPMLP